MYHLKIRFSYVRVGCWRVSLGWPRPPHSYLACTPLQIRLSSSTMADSDRDKDLRIARNRNTFKKWEKLEDGQWLTYDRRKFLKPDDEEKLLTRLVGSVRRDHRRREKNGLPWGGPWGNYYDFLPHSYGYPGRGGEYHITPGDSIATGGGAMPDDDDGGG